MNQIFFITTTGDPPWSLVRWRAAIATLWTPDLLAETRAGRLQERWLQAAPSSPRVRA